jgi:hypothetical protein
MNWMYIIPYDHDQGGPQVLFASQKGYILLLMTRQWIVSILYTYAYRTQLIIVYFLFQDKEYPVKAMRIATLQKEIQSLKISNQVCI